MKLILLPARYAVCHAEQVPAPAGEFFSLTRTNDELSVVCEERLVPEGVQREPGWRVLRFEGSFAFTEVGVLASVANPLRDAGIPILAVSTFNTDYVLVKDSQMAAASDALEAAGHVITA